MAVMNMQPMVGSKLFVFKPLTSIFKVLDMVEEEHWSLMLLLVFGWLCRCG